MIGKTFFGSAEDIVANTPESKFTGYKLKSQEAMKVTTKLINLGVTDTAAWIHAHTREECLAVLSEGRKAL